MSVTNFIKLCYHSINPWKSKPREHFHNNDSMNFQFDKRTSEIIYEAFGRKFFKNKIMIINSFEIDIRRFFKIRDEPLKRKQTNLFSFSFAVSLAMYKKHSSFALPAMKKKLVAVLLVLSRGIFNFYFYKTKVFSLLLP